MSSSDSEDDCYGNVAKKLQTMKSKYAENKEELNSLLNESNGIDEIVKKSGFAAKTETTSTGKVLDDSFDLSDDVELDRLIAASSKRVTRAISKRVTRASSKRSINCDVSTEEMPAPTRRKSDEVPNETSRGRGRGRGRGKGKRGQNESSSARGRNDSNTQNARGGRGRRGRGRNRQAESNPYFSIYNAGNSSSYPIYSVGNTDEYPDECESQGLFSKKPQIENDVVVIEENDSIDDNEELSVKVYWQNSEYFKFPIRRYQKITSIFDYFSKKDNVSIDKLFFTLNDRILKPDDTPDSIGYNIVKFIDGGIVNQSVMKLVTKGKEKLKDGIKLKFQCQNVRKPFETVVGMNEKLSVAMLKCAEFFEKSVDKLRFEFDGDSITGKTTAQDLELEGGECIDVKIVS